MGIYNTYYVSMKFHEKMLITEKVIKEIQKGRFIFTHPLDSFMDVHISPPIRA